MITTLYCNIIHSSKSGKTQSSLCTPRPDQRQNYDKFQVLDIACGGARYVRDFLEKTNSLEGIEITLIDQDPAAINFATLKQLKEYKDIIHAINIPISKIKNNILLSKKKFDLIISAGLFDYLNEKSARNLLTYFFSLLNDNGLISITNYSLDDQSAFVKEWFANWKLIFRDEKQMRAIFPKESELEITYSDNNSLIFALCKKQPNDTMKKDEK